MTQIYTLKMRQPMCHVGTPKEVPTKIKDRKLISGRRHAEMLSPSRLKKLCDRSKDCSADTLSVQQRRPNSSIALFAPYIRGREAEFSSQRFPQDEP